MIFDHTIVFPAWDRVTTISQNNLYPFAPITPSPTLASFSQLCKACTWAVPYQNCGWLNSNLPIGPRDCGCFFSWCGTSQGCRTGSGSDTLTVTQWQIWHYQFAQMGIWSMNLVLSYCFGKFCARFQQCRRPVVHRRAWIRVWTRVREDKAFLRCVHCLVRLTCIGGRLHWILCWAESNAGLFTMLDLWDLRSLCEYPYRISSTPPGSCHVCLPPYWGESSLLSIFIEITTDCV